jgi:hypothetical protein
MFFLHKEWRDADDSIEMVLLHWTTTRREQEPNWKRAHPTTVMIPQAATYPVLRSCPVWVIPPFSRRQLATAGADPDQRFLLSSFCEVIQRGRTWTTEVTQQEIRALTVTHDDTAGEYTDAMLYYCLDDFRAANRIPMRLEGLPSKYQCPPSLPEQNGSNPDYRGWARRSSLVARLPAPHIFRGQLWGLVGMRALYSIYLSHQWTYNPFAEGGIWLLQDGRPWEVQL